VGRLGQTPDEPPESLVACQIVPLAVPALQQRLQVVEHQQAAPGLQARKQLRDALLKRRGELRGRRLGEEGDAVGDQFLAGRRVAHRAPEHRLEVGSQALTQEGGQHTLADAAHAQQRHQAAALLEDPLRELGYLHLAAREVAGVESLHQIDAGEGCGLRESWGRQRCCRWGKRDGDRRSEQTG
jgi:hypothetical protein